MKQQQGVKWFTRLFQNLLSLVILPASKTHFFLENLRLKWLLLTHSFLCKFSLQSDGEAFESRIALEIFTELKFSQSLVTQCYHLQGDGQVSGSWIAQTLEMQKTTLELKLGFANESFDGLKKIVLFD